MELSSPLARPSMDAVASPTDVAPPASAVSWAAIFAGAAGAAALSLILLILGTGLGLSAVSPFNGEGASATTFGVSSILWLTFTQLAASAIGGFLAGRLRTRWISLHDDEVYFRDTAHGFLAWAVATLVTAATLASVIGSIVGETAQAAGGMAASAGGATIAAAAPAASAALGDSNANGVDNGYFADRLFRASSPEAAASSGATGTGTDASAADSRSQTPEVRRILVAALRGGSLPQDDATYLARLVSQRTGLSQADAQKRVDDTFGQLKAQVDQAKAQAKDAADKARKASAYMALWLFVSLLAGAFVASLAATFGGRRRDLF